MKKTRRAALAFLFAIAAASAQDDPRALFPLQAPIYVSGARLSRLELPVEVVAALSEDRADLRILDANGAETPFTIDAPVRARAGAVEVMRRPLSIVDVDRSRSDRPDGPPILRERYVLRGAISIDWQLSWDLALETAQQEFVRRVRVWAISTGGTETPLLWDESLFRLRESGRERLRLTVPRFAADRLRVEIEGEDGAYLEPEFRLEHSAKIAAPEQDRLELAVVDRIESGRETIVELERPRGVKPAFLTLASSTPAFSRSIEVWDEGGGIESTMLAVKPLYRIQGAVTLEDVDIPLGVAQGTRLRISIRNGDSPPLADLRFTAVFPRLSLLFSLPPQGNDTPSGTLLFGGGRARRPRYDLAGLQALLRPPQAGSRARIATELYQSSPARLGAIEPNPAFEAAPVLSYAMRPGSPVDERLYSHRRSVTLSPSADGLSVLVLGVEDLARAQPDLRDVRIVDAESRQWAYVSDRGEPRVSRLLEVRGPETAAGVSEYALELPAKPATLDRIELEIGAPFFDRPVELIAAYSGVEQSAYSGRLQRRAGESRPVAIDVDLQRIEGLKLRIEDGDDAPLPIESVQGRFPSVRLAVAAPAGDYTLLLGNPDDEAPSYELERVRAAVFSARGREARFGPLESNPELSARARLATGTGPQQALLWAALILVVGVLSAMTLRAVRQEPADESRSGGSDAVS